MASFFLRAGEGQYELHEPRDLARLLVTMARNKLASSARNLLSEKRDSHRREVDVHSLEMAPDISETPSSAITMLELVAKARGQLTEEERAIADLRGENKSWDEIAEALGGTPQSRRMQLSRALDRVTASLGINDN
ncbi:MAG: hypothetical protein ABL888_04525 [Pirellulaceae bacterium]